MTASLKFFDKYQEGFTVVEFLVVFTITAVIIAIALPSLNTYNTNQILKSTALELKTNLRQAQNNAMAGVKDCAIGGNESSTALLGWYVRFDVIDKTYTIAHHCYYNGTELTDTEYSLRTYQLKGVNQLTTSLSEAVILFKPVARGVSFYSGFTNSFDLATLLPDTEMTISLRNNNSATSTIKIFNSGEINVE